MTASVDIEAVREASVAPAGPWREVEHHATIGSTNARAAEIGRPWYVVVADHQSQGRGRLARRWEAPPGTSVAVSATVPVPATGSAWLPLLAGVAVADAIESVTSLSAVLKWPNDVLLPADGSRKVCGILCEVVALGDADPTDAGLVVIGAGLNLSQSRDQLPVPSATSLALAGAVDVDPAALLVAYLARLADLMAAPDAVVRAGYRQRCVTIGRSVTLSLPEGRRLAGLALDVDDGGRLVLEEAGGGDGPVAWAAGDVVHATGAQG
jgi:BirA family biotin operon repressor/biotin-[acetyl-CoA-carboxylase] ligase